MFFRRQKIPVFILGCQRSGTTICQNVFLKSKRFAVYREGNKHAMTDKWRLRPRDEIESLIENSKQRFLIFKPIDDSQLADCFLSEYSNSRVIWIYRDMFETANSAVAKWGSGQRKTVTWTGKALARSATLEVAMPGIMNWPSCAVYAERLNRATCEKRVEWTAHPIPEHTAAAVLWYLRNQFFFNLSLNENRRVLLVRYEKFASHPNDKIRRICKFIGARNSSRLSDGVYQTSIGKSGPPEITASVHNACLELTQKLDDRESESQCL